MRNVAKCLNIDVKDVGWLFNAFMKGIIKEIQDNKFFEARTFGKFIIRNRKDGFVQLDFKPKRNFRRLVNGDIPEAEMEIGKRTRRMLQINGFLEKD